MEKRMSLISRKAAIDGINNICPVDTEYDCTLLDRVDVRCVLSDLPSAQPERKAGEWIYKKYDDETGIEYHEFCSECGFPRAQIYGNFCAVCGAKMRGDGDE